MNLLNLCLFIRFCYFLVSKRVIYTCWCYKCFLGRFFIFYRHCWQHIMIFGWQLYQDNLHCNIYLECHIAWEFASINMLVDILTDPRYKDCRPRTRDNTHTNVVVYLINPCANSTGSKNGAEAEESASTLALFMCFQELLDSLPESMRKQTYLEIVPLHSVLSNNHHSSDQQVGGSRV